MRVSGRVDGGAVVKRVHFAAEVLFGTVFQPACENAAGRDAIADIGRPVEMTTDEREVTCKRCLRALGYEPAPLEQLTLVESNPLKDAA